jgi:Domain of unknown function (DUF4262)
MCWQCDHPGATYEDYLAHIRGTVDEYGWAVQGVERSGIHPPWAYTIGLTQAGCPELVVTGMPFAKAATLLNGVGEHVVHAEAPRPGDRVTLASGLSIEIVEVAEPTAHLLVAAAVFGPRIRALQIVHADYRGHWPWEPGYRGSGRGGQPVLGARAVPPASAA